MNKKPMKKHHIILLIVMLVILAVGAFIIIEAQNYAVKADYFEESAWFTENVTASMENRERDLQALDEYNKSVSADLIYNITFIYDGTDFPNLNWKQREKLSPKNVCNMDEFNLESLNIIGEDGTIWLSDDDSLLKKNIVEEGLLTADDLAFFNSDGYGTYKRRINEDGEEYSSNEPVNGYANGHKVRYYAVKVFGKDPEEKYYAVGADRNDLESEITTAYADLGAYFEPIVDYDGFSAFAVNTDTGIIDYTSYENKDLMGRLASDVGLEDVKALGDGQYHKVEINGDSRRVLVKNYESDIMGDYAIVAADIDADGPTRNAVMACIIVMIVTVCLLLNAGYTLAKERRKHMIKEYAACVIACVVLAGAVAFYISTISSISQAMTQSEVNAEVFSSYYRSGKENAANMSEFYKAKKVSVLKSIAIFLQQNQKELMDQEGQKVYEYYDTAEDGTKEYILDSNGNVTRSISENEDLKGIAEDEGYKDLYLVNSQGNTVMTSSENWFFTINGGKSGYDEEFNSVLERKAKSFYDYQYNDENGSEVVAVPYEMYISTDENGNTIYHDTDEFLKDKTGKIKQEYGLLVAISDTTSDLRLSMESIPREMLNSMRAAEGAELAVTTRTDDGGHAFVLASDGIREEDYEEMAIQDSYYLSDNYKFANINDIDRMIGISCLSEMKEMNLITVLDDADVQSQRWPIVIATIAAVLLGGIALIIYFRKLYKTEEEEIDKGIEEETAEVSSQQNGSLLKTLEILGVIFLLGLIVVFMLVSSNGYLRFIDYVITVKWEKGVHIFSISYFMYMIIVVIVIIAIAREFVHLLAPVLSARAETMLRLMLSLIQYGCIIAAIFYTLYLFGFQLGTVVTSASIMTIVIGLGANSLIGDILAGLFIIFEHEYQVGNWITIGNFTGEVKAIGLRTTKVEASNGNIKTFNNSKINEVLNLTDNYTTADVCISISNAVPVKHMNELVNTKLRKRVRSCREIVDGPMPGGIQEKASYANGFYNYRVKARCEQKDVSTVKTRMFTEFIEILKEENIEFL